MAGVAAVLREMGYCISAFSQMSLIWNGRWLMSATVRYIHMQQKPKAVIRTWVVQKETQYQDSPCRGCKWYAGPSTCYRGYPSWLPRSYSPDWGNSCGNIIDWSWSWHQPDYFLCCWCWDERRHSDQTRSQITAEVWPLFVSASSFVGECFSALEILAWYCHSTRQKYSILFGSSTNSLHCYLVCRFSLILCRHYLRNIEYVNIYFRNSA